MVSKNRKSTCESHRFGVRKVFVGPFCRATDSRDWASRRKSHVRGENDTTAPVQPDFTLMCCHGIGNYLEHVWLISLRCDLKS